MANPQPATLHASAEEASNGSGASVDIGTLHTAGRFTATVSAQPTGTLTLYIETSPDDATWVTVDQVAFSSTDPERTKDFTCGPLRRYVRIRWTMTAGPVTFEVGGEVHQVYCDAADVKRLGVRPAAIEELPVGDVLEHCIAASDEAEGYLNSAYEMPITAWGRDLRLHCSKMAVRYLFDFRGWDPEGADAVVMKGHDDALKWLDRISNGRIKPPGIVDQTPETFEGGSVVVSRPRRGW